MSNEKIITFLKKARVWTGFFLSAGEITEELSWTFAPNQGFLPVIHSSSSFGVFAAKYLNTNRVALPFLAMQGIAYIVDAILQFSLAAFEYPGEEANAVSAEIPATLKGQIEKSKHAALSMKDIKVAAFSGKVQDLKSTDEKSKPIATRSSTAIENHEKSAPVILTKPQRRYAFYKRMMNGFVSLLSAFLIAALMTIILVATIKVLVIAYCVQSAVEISLITYKIGLNVWRYFSSQKAIDNNTREETKALTKEHANKAENKQINIHKERQLEAQKNIIKQSTKLGVSVLIVALTVVSFLPVPILAQAAQVGLVLIAIGFLINLGVERYQKYKEQQAKAAEAIVKSPATEQEPPNNALALKKQLDAGNAPAKEIEEDKAPLLSASQNNTQDDAGARSTVRESVLARPLISHQPTSANNGTVEKPEESAVNTGIHLGNKPATSDEIYLKKCKMSQLNTQQYELVLQNVKRQRRDAEGRCQQFENNLVDGSHVAAVAA